jgi:predicted SAM-dependent methyltransferase
MKLNVGSGHPKGVYNDPEWVNIDIAAEGLIAESKKVLNISVMGMPAEWTDKFETVHCVHMLEHMNRNFRQQVIEQLYRVTAPGGALYLEVPDFQKVIEKLHAAYKANDTERIHVWKTSIYGKQRYTGDAHHWGFDAAHLQELAQKAGFQKTERWTNENKEKMISGHYKHEPVILLVATK